MFLCDSITSISHVASAMFVPPRVYHSIGAKWNLLDALFDLSLPFTMVNSAIALVFLVVFLRNRAIETILVNLYPNQKSFEAAFKTFSGASFVAVLVTIIWMTSIVSGRSDHVRTEILQLITILQAPYFLALWTPRIIVLSSILRRLYRSL